MRTRQLYLLPVVGTVAFVVLFFIATLYYPGGSQADANQIGFSWKDNYWCNLLMNVAINGEPNAAKPIAMVGVVVLAVTLVSFWFLFFNYTSFSKHLKTLFQLSALISMGLSLFIFSKWHDVLITIAGIFGMIALAGTFTGLYKLKWNSLLTFGMLNLLLVIINNIIYYTTDRYWLPVIQKITFTLFLLWICLVSLKMFKRSQKSSVFSITPGKKF